MSLLLFWKLSDWNIWQILFWRSIWKARNLAEAGYPDINAFRSGFCCFYVKVFLGLWLNQIYFVELDFELSYLILLVSSVHVFWRVIRKAVCSIYIINCSTPYFVVKCAFSRGLLVVLENYARSCVSSLLIEVKTHLFRFVLGRFASDLHIEVELRPFV